MRTMLCYKYVVLKSGLGLPSHPPEGVTVIFLLVLLVLYAMTWLLPRSAVHRRDRWRLALGGAMVVAGVMHLVQPGPFVQHLPAWIPERELLVAVSGLAEIGLGVAIVLPHPYRRQAGVLLGLFLVALFPANIYVAVAGVEVDGQPGGLYPWLRLGFQPPFIWIALWSTRSRAALEATHKVAA
jgi:uncharacterized membrane protein